MPFENSQGSFDAIWPNSRAMTWPFGINESNVRARSEECFLLIFGIAKQDRKSTFMNLLKVSNRPMLSMMGCIVEATCFISRNLLLDGLQNEFIQRCGVERYLDNRGMLRGRIFTANDADFKIAHQFLSSKVTLCREQFSIQGSKVGAHRSVNELKQLPQPDATLWSYAEIFNRRFAAIVFAPAEPNIWR